MSICNTPKFLREQWLAEKERKKNKRILEKDGVFISKVPIEIDGIAKATPAAQTAIDELRKQVPRNTDLKGYSQQYKNAVALAYADVAQGEDYISNGTRRLEYWLEQATAPAETWRMDHLQLPCPIGGAAYLRDLPRLLEEHVDKVKQLAKQQYTPVVHQTPLKGPAPSPTLSWFDPRRV